jgi:hypothetical protein
MFLVRPVAYDQPGSLRNTRTIKNIRRSLTTAGNPTHYGQLVLSPALLEREHQIIDTHQIVRCRRILSGDCPG